MLSEREKLHIVDGYLRRLSQQLEGVPASARRELVEDLREHIEAAWEEAPTHDEAALRNILERLGEPEDLAQEERERLGLAGRSAGEGDGLSIAAVVLTALFWPVGIVLAWISARWCTREKVIATAIPVLGLALLVGMMLPAQTVAFESVVVETREVAVDGEAPGAPAGSFTADRPGPSPWLTVGASALALYGAFGAPLTSAIYLAVRRRRDMRPTGVLLPAVAGVLAVFLLFAAVLMPSAVYMAR